MNRHSWFDGASKPRGRVKENGDGSSRWSRDRKSAERRDPRRWFLLDDARRRGRVLIPSAFTSEQLFCAPRRTSPVNEIVPRIAEIEAKTPGFIPELLRKAGGARLDGRRARGIRRARADKTTSMSRRGGTAAVVRGVDRRAHGSWDLADRVLRQRGRRSASTSPGWRRASCSRRTRSPSPRPAATPSPARRARSAADGKHVLNGSKMWITNAGFADVFIGLAKVDGKNFPRLGPGTIVPASQVGAEEHKMGIRGSSTTSLSFDNCPCPSRTCSARSARGTRSPSTS